jgi:hypothetical protein
MRRSWLLVAALAACASTEVNESLYFDDPRTAVTEISRLLRARDWSTLARYYDLEGTDLRRSDLESGAFFYTEQRPELAHPGGFWRYRHPFAPGFEYVSSRELGSGGRIEVTVGIEIDQGGGPPQRGMRVFRMRRSARGYRVLPEP